MPTALKDKYLKLLAISAYFSFEFRCRTANRLTTGQSLSRPTVCLGLARAVWRSQRVRLSGDR